MVKIYLKLPSYVRKLFLTIFISIIIVFVSVITFKFVVENKVQQVMKNEHTELITIAPGTSFYHFTKQLVKKGWIENRFWLRSHVKFTADLTKIKSGTYQVKPNTRLIDFIEQVVDGKEHQFSITFIEGTSIKQWIELLDKAENITHKISDVFINEKENEFSVSYFGNNEKMEALTVLSQQININHTNPEGYFYPDTYAYSAGDSDLDILTRAHLKLVQILDEYWNNRDLNLPYKTKNEALTMASIIEKESGKYAEHEIIASVFINRIHKKMRLQTDPTVIYGLGENYFGDIKFKHLRTKTPYNTRKIKAFPPTPIAMPGKHALNAAFNPATTEYLYFVSNGNGEHIFSENLSDHNAAVNKYQRKK